MKRSIDLVDEIFAEMRPPKRLSMLHNTPKQWKEQRKTILRMSKGKLMELGDIESNLRKSVLINNTYRKMRRELKEQCPYRVNTKFAAYSTEVVSNRVPVVKPRNGYTSMARDDIEEYVHSMKPAICYDETLPAVAESHAEVKPESADLTETEGEDCTKASPQIVDPTSMDCQSRDDVKEFSTISELVQGGQLEGCMDTSDQPIDYTLKAKDRPIFTDSNSQSIEQSPLCSSTLVDHSHNATRPRHDIEMDLQITPSPSQQGSSHNDTDQLEKVGPEINSNDHSIANSCATTQEKSICDALDFSLCKSASKPYDYLPSFLEPNVIPFSTSSLVSIIASREYHPQYLSQPHTTNAQQMNQTLDTVNRTDPENTDSSNTACANNNLTSLFCEEDLHTVDTNSHTDDNLSDNMSEVLYSSNINCDSDVNQHIWACFQHFNMAVACS